MAKVSIIVPVYKTERYLRECLESLVNQSLQDIEIIIVDDGSTDNSHRIIAETVPDLRVPLSDFVQAEIDMAKSIVENSSASVGCLKVQLSDGAWVKSGTAFRVPGGPRRMVTARHVLSALMTPQGSVAAANPFRANGVLRKACVAFDDRNIVDRNCGRVIVIRDGAEALVVTDRSIGFIGQIDEEGFVDFIQRVALDGDGDGLGGDAGVEDQGGGGDGCVITAGEGGAVGGGVIDGDGQAAGGIE